MHSPLEIARNFVEIGIHKVKLSAWKMIILGIFAGLFIGFAGVASTTAAATVENASLGRLLSAVVFPAGMAMVLVAGSELFTGNNLIIVSVLEKKVYFGPCAAARDQVHIGECATVGINAAVFKDVPEGSSAIGNPAKIMPKSQKGLFDK